MNDAQIRTVAISYLKHQLDYMEEHPSWVFFAHLKTAMRENIDMLESIDDPGAPQSFRSYGPQHHGEYVHNYTAE